MATRIFRWTDLIITRPPPSPSPISKLLGGEDLLIEILSRLGDTRSVWRCKSVCKRWNSLISAPYFSRRFVSRSRSVNAEPPLLIPSGVRGPIWSFLPVPEEIPFGAIVLDCAEDLLLLTFEDWSGKNHLELRRSYLVCNPFTQQWVALPLAPERSAKSIARILVRDRQPASNSRRILNLDDGKEVASPDHCGYEFCVVIMSDLYSELDVFYSRSRSWSKSPVEGSLISSSWDIAVSWNGKLYWKNRHRGLLVGWNPFGLFDDEDDDDDIRHISLPPALISANHLESSSTVWVSQGVLHMILREKMYKEDDYLSVWRLDEGGVGWRRRYSRVSLKKLICDSRVFRGSKLDIYSPVAIHIEKPEVVFLLSSVRGKTAIISCNLKKKELGLFAYQRDCALDYHVFQPRVTVWPTPIPNYEELRGAYNGSFSCWIQPSEQSTS
ncbi:unnamed protein product [Linum trigynum]|uniref:F-box domain-containing protein n=1 Tax=Linum trigynum TaxID=586398 RepID=A0AAV2G3V8_9ROSI